MKVVFLLLVLFHGLIHTMGFLKAFQLAEINELKTFISRPLGIVWLFVAIVFLITAIVFIMNRDWWWIPGIIAILTSQLLIILYWQDAKFGSIANLVILIVVIVAFATWNFNNQVQKEMDDLVTVQQKETPVITESMIETLPLPVKKWADNIGLVGNKQANTLKIKQLGKMKLEPGQADWYEAEAEQLVSLNQPGFVWGVRMKMLPFIHVYGLDSFQNSEGKMTMKIASLIPVAQVENNEKVDQSSLQRYLLELPWYPSAMLSPYIQWDLVDEFTATATLSYQGMEGTATYTFDDNGDLVKVSAYRYKDNDEQAELVECVGEVQETEIIHGVKIPTKMDVSWMLDDGKFTWYKIELMDWVQK